MRHFSKRTGSQSMSITQSSNPWGGDAFPRTHPTPPRPSPPGRRVVNTKKSHEYLYTIFSRACFFFFTVFPTNEHVRESV